MLSLKKIFTSQANDQERQQLTDFCLGAGSAAKAATVALAIFAAFSFASNPITGLPTTLFLGLLAGVCWEVSIVADNLKRLYQPLSFANVASQVGAGLTADGFAAQVFKGAKVAGFLFQNLLADHLRS